MRTAMFPRAVPQRFSKPLQITEFLDAPRAPARKKFFNHAKQFVTDEAKEASKFAKAHPKTTIAAAAAGVAGAVVLAGAIANYRSVLPQMKADGWYVTANQNGQLTVAHPNYPTQKLAREAIRTKYGVPGEDQFSFASDEELNWRNHFVMGWKRMLGIGVGTVAGGLVGGVHGAAVGAKLGGIGGGAADEFDVISDRNRDMSFAKAFAQSRKGDKSHLKDPEALGIIARDIEENRLDKIKGASQQHLDHIAEVLKAKKDIEEGLVKVDGTKEPKKKKTKGGSRQYKRDGEGQFAASFTDEELDGFTFSWWDTTKRVYGVHKKIRNAALVSGIIGGVATAGAGFVPSAIAGGVAGGVKGVADWILRNHRIKKTVERAKRGGFEWMSEKDVAHHKQAIDEMDKDELDHHRAFTPGFRELHAHTHNTSAKERQYKRDPFGRFA